MSISRDLRHELRTPLNHIIGYSEMLIEDFAGTDTQYAAAFSQVIDDAHALAKLINDLASEAPNIADGVSKETNRFGDWRLILDKLGERLVAIRTSVADHPDWLQDLEKIVQATVRLRELFESGMTAVQLSDPTPAIPSVMFAGKSAESEAAADAIKPASDDAGRLLVVDDNRYNLELMARRLRRDGFDVSVAQSGRDALTLISQQEFDVVLLDWLMPDFSGAEVLAALRKDFSPHELPVIVVTAKHGSDNIVNALVSGANDYITKPVDFPVAVARIATQVYLRRITADLKRANEKLRRFSYVDGLTGIPNRRQLNEFLDHAWQENRRDTRPLSVIMLDVDHFKAYNDNYGHEAGDQVLIQLAQGLAANVLDQRYLLARYGGEEFAAVLPDTELSSALEIADRLRLAVFDLGIDHAHHSSETRVTISLGVASLTDEDRKDPNFGHTQLLQRADQALYQSKRSGRNRVGS